MKSLTPRMFSGKRSYHKVDIATGQLETAIRLFLVDGCDMFSAITLAAAAGEILHQLVLDAGKEPFIDYLVHVNEFKNPGPTPKRNAIIKLIHENLFINKLKHHDPATDEIVEFDAEECALAAILKAMSDYKTLTGHFSQSMTAFLGWTYKNLDSSKIMKDFESAPEKFK